jgi:hypothetical protein
MFRRSRGPEVDRANVEAMTAVIRQFEPHTRQALYAAANRGSLRRRSWDGCALNRAAEELGSCVTNKGEASRALGVPVDVVAKFLLVWDGLRGSDAACTALLRDAILAAGLFEDLPQDARDAVDAEPATDPASGDAVPVEAESWMPGR